MFWKLPTSKLGLPFQVWPEKRIDVFQPHQKYLGFSWDFNGTTKYFIFAVLPFGLSTVPFVFITVVCPLVKFWRFHSIKIACFSGDSLGIEYEFLEACNNSNFVRNTLRAAGFIPSSNKSLWTPCQKITRLGIDIDITNDIIKITSDRISNVFNTIEFLTDKIFISAWELSKLI